MQPGLNRQAPVTAAVTKQDRRLSSNIGLGVRARTELDFSRSRPVTSSSPGVSNLTHGHNMVRAPSVTDTSEHSSTTGVTGDYRNLIISCSNPGKFLGPSLLGSDTCIRKGVMWVQQEKLFSRWKERFIILTSGYLHIFKKSTSRISDMGPFVNKVS